MLKVKKKIQNSESQNNDELTDLQNQIKNLFITDQKNKKMIMQTLSQKLETNMRSFKKKIIS